MNIVDFLFALSLGLFGINTVFISIIYSMLPFHLKEEDGQFIRWSIYPSEIVEGNRNSFILLIGSFISIYVHIMLNQSFVLQKHGLEYIFLAFSSIFIISGTVLFYQTFKIIWNDITERTYREQERIFFNKSIEEMQELDNKYGINPSNHLTVTARDTINKELSYFEDKTNNLNVLFQVCKGLSEIYNNRIPIQRIEKHFNSQNDEFNELLEKLEEKNCILKEDNFIKLK